MIVCYVINISQDCCKIIQGMVLENNGGTIMKLKVIGVGTFGTKLAAGIASENIPNVSCAAIDTDGYVIENSELEDVLLIGNSGLGTGGQVSVGKEAAEAATTEIEKMISDADVILLTAGMGGGTGSGTSPIIARIAHEKGIIVYAAVTHVFDFEGPYMTEFSIEGIKELAKYVDSVLVAEVKEHKKSHKPELFGIQFSKSDIKEVNGSISIKDLNNLIFEDISDFIKTAADSKSKEELRNAENTFIGYTFSK